MPTQTAPAKPSTTETVQQLSRAKDADTTIRYTIDGAAATAQQVRALNPNRVSHVEVSKAGGQGYITIALKPNGDSTPLARAVPDGDRISISLKPDSPIIAPSDSGIVFILNGNRVTGETIKALDRSTIVSVEVIKGPTAAAQYKDQTARGFVVVTTRDAKQPPSL